MDHFILGTTPTHIFRLSIDTDTIQKLRITYRQNGMDVMTLKESDVEFTENSIKYTLSQEETLKFQAGAAVEVQLKVLTTQGAVIASPVITLGIDKILNTEVLT